VLLKFDRVRPAMLDRVAEAVQGTDARVAAVGEHELPSRSHTDHLVVEDVRRHPDQLEVAPALAQHLVSGRERDQMGEPLERHAVTVVDEVVNRIVKRDYLSHDVRIANTCTPCAQAIGSDLMAQRARVG
jgi:hypothetical protein